jgi:chromate reductase, NAD(P)H dehydrogenase (quinone)
MKGKKILLFAGSTRKGSYNKSLCIHAKELLDNDNQVTLIDLKNTPLPLYDADYEQSNPYPKGLSELKSRLMQSDVIIIASPEYNGGITAVLKNTIDWLTRSEDKKADISPFRHKTAILMSASPSMLGGTKGLIHLRLILSHIKMLVLPEQFTLAKAHETFDENNRIKSQAYLERLKSVLMQESKALS